MSRYILSKFQRDPSFYWYADAGSFDAHYVEKKENSGPPTMGIQFVRGTGKFDKSRITIHSRDVSSRCWTFPATAEGVKSSIRKIRDQEQAQIDAIDARIADLQSQIAKLRKDRRAALATAWQKGNVVTLAEIKAKADENFAKRGNAR